MQSVEDILRDWRECERALEAATDAADREALEAQCAALAIEHREAVDARQTTPRGLSGSALV